MTSVTETFSVPLINARVVLTLAGTNGDPVEGFVSGQTVAGLITPPIAANGWQADLTPNSTITPSGTVWRRTVYADNLTPIVDYATVPAAGGPYTFDSILAAPPAVITPPGAASAADLALKVAKAGDTMTGPLAVPDAAYDATTWNGSAQVPTKNAVRDKIEALTGAYVPTTGARSFDWGVAGSLAPSGAEFEGVYETYGNEAPFVSCIGGANPWNSQQDDVFYFAGYNRSNGGAKKVAGVPGIGLHLEAHVYDNGDDRGPSITHNFEWNFDYTYPTSGGERMLAFRTDRNDPTVYTRWVFSLSNAGTLGRFCVQTFAGVRLLDVTADGNVKIAKKLTLGNDGVSGSGALDVTGRVQMGGAASIHADYPGVADALVWDGSAGTLKLSQPGTTMVPLTIKRKTSVSAVQFLITDESDVSLFEVAANGTVKFGNGPSIVKSAANTIQFNLGAHTLTSGDNGSGIDLNAIDGNLRLFANSGSIVLRSNVDVSTKNIATDTTTGTKIGTATGQKLGFFNATPVVQPSGTPAASTDLASVILLANSLRTNLLALGLVA